VPSAAAGRRFVRADIFAARRDRRFAPESFDVVFCSGAMNLDLGNNRVFLPRAIERMAALSRRHVVFNLLHARAEPKEKPYFFYDPGEAAKVAQQHGQVRVIDDYLHNDFTVIVDKCRGERFQEQGDGDEETAISNMRRGAGGVRAGVAPRGGRTGPRNGGEGIRRQVVRRRGRRQDAGRSGDPEGD